jgi:hypothetical protein
MEQDDGLLRSGLEIGLETLKVESNGLLVEVPVSAYFKSGILEERNMVPPGRNGKVNGLRVRVVASKECTTDAERTSSRDGLRNGDSTLFNRVALCTIRQKGGVLGEFRKTSNREVFLVGLRRLDKFLGPFHTRQNVGLSLSIPVSTNTKVDLPWVLVRLKGFGDTKNGVRRASWN